MLVIGMVLVSPAVTVGAQTDDTIPGDSVPVDSVPDDSVPGDSVPEDSVPEDSVPDDSVPEDSVPEDSVPEDTTPEVLAEFITVEQTPDEEQGPCNGTPALVLRNFIGGDDEAWRLTIIVDEPLCSPIDATAAVYAMAGFGEAWPQTLTETLDFTLQEAGRTVVSFSKDAQCSQYDVIVGDTPPVIAPLGEWHGPLLFPFDVNTSFQNWDGCPEVAAVTTLPPEPAPAVLALTGSNATPFTAGGAFLLLLGAGALLFSRRRVA